MKTLLKRAVGITMVVTCLMGTTAFAATNEQGTQEIIELEACTAEELIGGIPEYIQGPDREDLRVMLSNIDEYNAAGQYEQAEMIWESVLEMLSMYQEQFGSNNEEDIEPQSDDEWIFEQIERYEERIMRCENAGYYEEAEELRQELERLLMEFFGEQDPDMNHEGPEVELTPDEVKMIEETEAEIERLDREGDFEAADSLREDLDRFFSERFGEQHEEAFEGHEEGQEEWHEEGQEEWHEAGLPQEEVERIIAETEEEIEHFERIGDFEAAENLRNELEMFIHDNENEHHGEPNDFPFDGEQDEFFGHGIFSIEDVLSKTGHDLSPGQWAIISYLVNQINEVAAQAK